ncbi:MAG: bacteriohopanetetrol glucosamine biosynthesis glycosyltransferase HpnI [Acidobacteriia bacterium]|nr:bacteriohopanetetrol glucosamine biosynthesis glycosyltransferase HpnI [Terriglobia bacterium]
MPTLLHSLWRYALLLVAAAPLAYYAAATFAAVRFFRRERARQLPAFTPPVSVLKPVRGVDFASYENFASFCRQDYPDFELLFAVNDSADPAVALVHRLMAEFPHRQIRLFIGAETVGSNRKVNKLCRLARAARHDILVVSDGDVRVGPRYLREVAAPFADPQTGVVTCFYRGIAQENLFAAIEAIGASSDFFAGVLMAHWLEGMSFALGATMATTRAWLAKIGGFEALAATHSDDYEFGHRIALQGGRIVLSREPVWTMYPAQSARGFWEHQVRWARTVRLCRPLSFAGLIFTHGLPWALLAVFLVPGKALAAAWLAAYLLLRLLQAWVVGVWGVGDDVLRRKLWLVPFRDALYFAVWLASFASNRITWGGTQFAMQKGQMVAVEEDNPAAAALSTRPRS